MSADIDGAIKALREVILAGEHYRLAAATYLGLTINESQALSYLLSRGPLGQQDLAQAMSMTTGSITSLVDRLEQRGYVERTPHATDRRRLIVSLSEFGTDALNETRVWMRDAFLDVPDDQLVDLAHTMDSVALNLRARADKVPTTPPDGTPRSRRRR